jgi:hypothetical protein
MKYTIQRLDGRFTYRDWFQYYIGFGTTMSNNQGPLNFDHCLQWFVQTYGWSAEIRQYSEISRWVNMNQTMTRQMIRKFGNNHTKGIPPALDLPNSCNPYWSWTNGYDDLRLYVKSDQELSFFQLANPIDQ